MRTLCFFAAALALLCVAVAFVVLRNRNIDERLIGTWLSDRERTVEGMNRSKRFDEDQLARLGDLFGKLRVTYTSSHYFTELNGMTDKMPYEVLGKDRCSVVIRERERRETDLELSEFTVITSTAPTPIGYTRRSAAFRNSSAA